MTATWRILEGDCRETLASLEAGSVQTCVTSPPYYSLRDYGHEGQIGLEPSPDEFVAALVEVFREVRRVLADDGTIWLNLGDSYAATMKGSGGTGKSGLMNDGREEMQRLRTADASNGRAKFAPRKFGMPEGVKPKDLIGIPWMVAFALRADGWYLRMDIIWSKLNPMPESVTDRPTKAHEYVFLLSKSPRYFYDADAVREAPAPATIADARIPFSRPSNGNEGSVEVGHPLPTSEAGRNKRSVWTVATQPYPGAHFATFPPKLIEPCILAGCPERKCGECGAPWERVVERTKVVKPSSRREEWQANDERSRTQTGGTMTEPPTSRTLGFKPSCGHDAPAVPGVVLDPFAGAGTTGMVALRHGRSFVGIELNPEYVRLARDRIIADAPLLNSYAEAA